MVAIFPKRDPPLCFAHRHGQAQWATTLQQSNIAMENHQFMFDWPIKKTSIGLVDLQVGHDYQRICHRLSTARYEISSRIQAVQFPFFARYIPMFDEMFAGFITICRSTVCVA
jgi:hypothetical protein